MQLLCRLETVLMTMSVNVSVSTTSSALHCRVTKQRNEIVVMGTRAARRDAPDAEWREFEFKCKPGAVARRPCLISPYHYRLDWLAWFAGFQVRLLSSLFLTASPPRPVFVAVALVSSRRFRRCCLRVQSESPCYNCTYYTCYCN